MRVGSATCEGIVGWYAVALSFVCGSMTEPCGCSERAEVSFEMGVDIVAKFVRVDLALCVDQEKSIWSSEVKCRPSSVAASYTARHRP